MSGVENGARVADPGADLIADELRAARETLVDEVLAGMRRDIPFYRTSTAVEPDELRATVGENIDFLIAALNPAATFDTSAARATGARRADMGAPLASVMHAYRIGVHRIWDALRAAVERHAEIDRRALLNAVERMWDAQDTFVDAMAEGHHARNTERVLEDEEERAAMTEHLLSGQVQETSLWDIAQALRIPVTGPYIAVVAESPSPGRHALPSIAARLRAIGRDSAWRLGPDRQIGLVHVPRPADQRAVIELLERIATTPVGVSSPFPELVGTPMALRYAQIALAGRGDGVSVFDGSVLGIATAASPATSADLARSVLAGLYALPDDDREVLTDTFRVWSAVGGSVNEAAAQLVCHPNTVRHRLRRIEQVTGRSVSAPRELAELCLAFEADERFRIKPAARPDATAP